MIVLYRSIGTCDKDHEMTVIDVHKLTELVDREIHSSQNLEFTTKELSRALSEEPNNEDLQLLNDRWQTHLNQEYIRSHKLGDFLDSLVEFVLKCKSPHPLEDMLVALDEQNLSL